MSDASQFIMKNYEPISTKTRGSTIYQDNLVKEENRSIVLTFSEKKPQESRPLGFHWREKRFIQLHVTLFTTLQYQVLCTEGKIYEG